MNKQIYQAPIKELYTLSFDPNKAEPAIQRVFKDRIARTIWLAIKGQHLVSQYFNQDCVDIARWMRQRLKAKERMDGGVLFNMLSRVGVLGTEEQDFAERLIPYVSGEKKIAWIVASKEME